MASPGLPCSKALSCSTSGYQRLFNWAGRRGRAWVDPQQPPAFFCQGSGYHPTSKDLVWLPTLARLDAGETDLREEGVRRKKSCRRSREGGGFQYTGPKAAQGLHWFLYPIEITIQRAGGDSLASGTCTSQHSVQKQYQSGSEMYRGVSGGGWFFCDGWRV